MLINLRFKHIFYCKIRAFVNLIKLDGSSSKLKNLDQVSKLNLANNFSNLIVLKFRHKNFIRKKSKTNKIKLLVFHTRLTKLHFLEMAI